MGIFGELKVKLIMHLTGLLIFTITEHVKCWSVSYDLYDVFHGVPLKKGNLRRLKIAWR